MPLKVKPFAASVSHALSASTLLADADTDTEDQRDLFTTTLSWPTCIAEQKRATRPAALRTRHRKRFESERARI